MKMDGITININLDVSDETINSILRILEIWQNNHPEKRIVGENKLCEDGYKYFFKVEDAIQYKNFKKPIDI